MFTLYAVLALAALVCAILSAWSKAGMPLWVSVLLLAVLEVLHVLPVK